MNWSTDDRNNKAFLAQTIVATPNGSLSIPNALKHERPDDYLNNWPPFSGRSALVANPSPFWGSLAAVVFGGGGNTSSAKEFVRFLVNEGWLAHYLNFSGERVLPAMPSCSKRRSGLTRTSGITWRR